MNDLRSKLRALALIASAAAALAAAVPQEAGASSSQFTVFEAPDLLLNASVQRATVDELAALGVDSIRFVMYWRDVAPLADQATRPPLDLTEPAAYGRAWAPYDGLIAAAEGHGMRVFMTVSGPVPRWATSGQRDQVTSPSPVEFERFMLAVGRRYGDFVDVWSIWNEPNHPLFLQPQFRGGSAVSPAIYRELFIAGERGLRVSGKVGSKPVLMGETAPRGTERVVAPLRFLRGALCLNGSYRRARRCERVEADGWATHPYTVAGNPFFRPGNADDVTIGVVSRLTRALDRAARAGMVRSRLPVYLSEFGVQSFPDPFGVSLAQQHEFRGIAERIAYRNSRVRGFSQYLLRDSQPRSGPESERYSGFESGLRFSDGREKPSYGAFRLPLVIERSGSRGVRIWGLVRPARGRTSATVEVADRGGAFRRLRTVRTNSRGYLSLRSANRSGRRWRLVWTDSENRTFRGPPTRGYGRR